jgi:RecB family exonuclease
MSRLPLLDKCRKFRSENTTSQAAEEGTHNHELIEALIAAWMEARQERPKLTLLDTLAEADVELESGQRQALQEVLRVVDQYWPEADQMLVEERVRIFHPDGSEFIFGTADLVFAYPGRAVIIDYKFGSKRVDPAETNKQGWGYALGVLQQMEAEGRPLTEIRVVFIQPRLNFVTVADFPAARQAELKHTLKRQVEEAKDPASPRTPGDQCRYCAERGTCPVLANLTAVVHRVASQLPVPVTFDVELLTDPKQMALAYLYAKRVEPFVEAVKKSALAMAQAGFDLTVDVPGQETSFQVAERSADRELGEAPGIYQAVKDVLDPEAFTACVNVRLGALERIYAEARVERAKVAGQKLTKKAAIAELQERLTSAGLVTRSATKIAYLKEVPLDRPVIDMA